MGRIKEECFSGWPNRARADDSKEVFRVEKDDWLSSVLNIRVWGDASSLRETPFWSGGPDLVVLNLLDAAAWEVSWRR